ncbi:hypothetical protein CORC01_09917 [Colletotrichum orchidophilum]|uniref:Uncharacterized protein n=1 Tax=Colletotrichum orchidophilum TaxID=1209926 RepID=A0A1G4B059_9PEZI|nr:uncharacterized protein CORC01_09917 [Colletotrichum orchidophilum]OHE94810.1 hypothetical protein CORC01_09917 [Colletotrichum orchidophilum]
MNHRGRVKERKSPKRPTGLIWATAPEPTGRSPEQRDLAINHTEGGKSGANEAPEAFPDVNAVDNGRRHNFRFGGELEEFRAASMGRPGVSAWSNTVDSPFHHHLDHLLDHLREARTETNEPFRSDLFVMWAVARTMSRSGK